TVFYTLSVHDALPIYAIWQSNRIPLDVRAEYARNATVGSGYWIEGAYRMRKSPVLKAFMRKSQAEVRFEQFFTPSAMGMGGASRSEEHTSELQSPHKL